jgi:hypothetical protein
MVFAAINEDIDAPIHKRERLIELGFMANMELR